MREVKQSLKSVNRVVIQASEVAQVAAEGEDPTESRNRSGRVFAEYERVTSNERRLEAELLKESERVAALERALRE